MNATSVDWLPEALLDAAAVPASRARPEAVDNRFGALLRAYRGTGGLTCGRELEARMVRHGRNAGSALARLSRLGAAVFFDWAGERWWPMFQFTAGAEVRPNVASVINELTPAFTDVDLAIWFVESNSWLDGARPVDALEVDLPDVLAAARADRYIATA